MQSDSRASKLLPKGIARVAIAKGSVVVQADPKIAARGLAVRVGENLLPLEEVRQSDVADLIASDQYRPDFDPENLVHRSQSQSGSDVDHWIGLNELEEWTLSGSQTVQVSFLKDAQPGTIILNRPIMLPAHTKPIRFSAEMAAHRASGNLILTRRFVNDAEGHEERFIIPFDPTKVGGRNISEYSHASLMIQPSDQDSELEMALELTEYRDDESGQPPYLFLANPVAKQDDPLRQEEDLHVLTLMGEPRSANSIWLRASVPAMVESGESLELVIDRDAIPLLSGTDVRISLIEDHGHSLLMSATQDGTYLFLLDGEFAFTASLGPQSSWVRFPKKCQTGGYRHLMITDETGTQKFFSSFVLMPTSLTPIDVLHQESRAPYPTMLMNQSRFRFAALRAHMESGLGVEGQAQVAYALGVVEGGHGNVKLKPLRFPEAKNPDVSIVIPAHNKVEVTYLALASLLLAHNDTSFEVIVVDDASTDETCELEDIVSGITVIHNEQPQRFIRACNAGAEKARGKFIMLLNNDVEVTNGWLDELVAAFDRFENVGLVGAKLLYPDGRLQEAGGIVWGSGNPWNYGNRQNPWEPKFCYTRQVDYVSGAALMTTREIWETVGGLSNYLEPMYFEDTDLAFKIREAGYKTFFVPSSIVYHFEGMTSGTDQGTGFKRYQEVNRPKFKRRWVGAFAGGGSEGVNPDLEKDRGIVGRVLFIDYATPRPDRDAGSYAAIQEIRLVQSLGYKVVFLPCNLAHLGSYTDDLERMGVEVNRAPFHLSIQEYLDAHAGDFDAFYITRYQVAKDVIDSLRTLAPHTPILFNNADLHFLRELRAALVAGSDELLAEARKVREQELKVMCEVDLVLSYNDVEHAVIQSHTEGRAKVAKCPWVVDFPATVPGLEGRAGISFLGSYDHGPNKEGVLWFAEEIMPLIKADHPDLEFFIYGSRMPEQIKMLESDVIRPEGFVEDVSDAYDRHRMFIAPLLSGAGIKGKVLAALAHGIPSILTPTAAEGTGVRHRHDCIVANTPSEWRAAIHELQTDDDLWRSISENARAFVKEDYSFQKGRTLMRGAFESVGLFSPVE